jgi:O-antigen ligase
LWPEWELSWWKARCSDAACVAAHPDGHFTGLQDHLHNDPLEVLIDRGVAGFLTLVLALLVPLSTIGRRRDDSAAFLFAAMIALLGRALIDFPLERPADLCLLALLASLTPAPDDPESSCESPQSASS